MHVDKLREEKRRKIDPLEKFDAKEKSPVATTTTGPVRVGISVGTQPVGVELRPGTPGPTIAVTIDNAGSGEIEQITNVLLFVPKGIKVTELAGGRALGTPAKKTCAELKENNELKEEAKLCNDDITNAYLISSRESGAEPLGSFITFRAYTQVEDASKLLKPSIVTIGNIRVSTTYSYLLKEEKTFSVEEPSMQVRGETQPVPPAAQTVAQVPQPPAAPAPAVTPPPATQPAESAQVPQPPAESGGLF